MGGRVKSYRDLLVWQRGMDLSAEVYRLSREWPKEEMFGLTSQARRAATSIPASIAEGYGRQSTASYSHFLKTASGSSMELETHLLIAERVGLASPGTFADVLERADELDRMIGGLIRSINQRGPDR